MLLIPSCKSSYHSSSQSNAISFAPCFFFLKMSERRIRKSIRWVSKCSLDVMHAIDNLVPIDVRVTFGKASGFLISEIISTECMHLRIYCAELLIESLGAHDFGKEAHNQAASLRKCSAERNYSQLSCRKKLDSRQEVGECDCV